MKLALALLLTCSFMSTYADSIEKIVEVDERSKVSSENEHSKKEKRKRRKRVQMCHECGKPETQCDCEGEEHGVEKVDD